MELEAAQRERSRNRERGERGNRGEKRVGGRGPKIHSEGMHDQRGCVFVKTRSAWTTT
jgi:hypothetical protein